MKKRSKTLRKEKKEAEGPIVRMYLLVK